jgi:hypothetical protein
MLLPRIALDDCDTAGTLVTLCFGTHRAGAAVMFFLSGVGEAELVHDLDGQYSLCPKIEFDASKEWPQEVIAVLKRVEDANR